MSVDIETRIRDLSADLQKHEEEFNKKVKVVRGLELVIKNKKEAINLREKKLKEEHQEIEKLKNDLKKEEDNIASHNKHLAILKEEDMNIQRQLETLKKELEQIIKVKK